MTVTDALIIEHFRVRQVRFNADHIGKWYARLYRGGFLCHDGQTRMSTLGEGLLADALFETYADVIDAYQLWLKQEATR